MSILFVTDKPYPPEPRIKNEANALLEYGVNVQLLSVSHKSFESDFELINGLKVHRIILPSIFKKLHAIVFTIPLYYLFLYKKLFKKIDTFEFDFLYIHNIILYPILYLRYRKKAKIILDIHENLPEIIKQYPHYKTLIGKLIVYPTIWRRVEKWCIATCDLCVVVAPEAKTYYRSYIKSFDNYEILPNMTDKNFGKRNSVDASIKLKYEQDFMILYVGDTGLRRGLLTAVRAMALIKDQIPNAKLVVLGSSRTDQVINKEIDRLGLQQWIEMKGWTNDALFPDYMKAAQVGISPLHRNIHHDTTYANKIFQYLACGKPIVVSDCTSQKNFVEKYGVGLVHKEQDHKDLAEKIVRLGLDHKLYTDLLINVEKIRDEFTWEEYIKRLVDKLEQIQR